MCKRSCCNKSREGAGVAAVAVLAAGAIVAVKIGPAVARIIHLAVEVLTIVLLTAASALAAIVLTWLTVRIVRWRVRQHHPRQPVTLRPVPTAANVTSADPQPGCLACGDTRTVLRAITGAGIRPGRARSASQPGRRGDRDAAAFAAQSPQQPLHPGPDVRPGASQRRR